MKDEKELVVPDCNPHYVAYAKFHGKTPRQMMKHDIKEFPGGRMCGFILWMSRMKQEFWKVNRRAFLDRHTISDHDAWGAFLQKQAAQKVA